MSKEVTEHYYEHISGKVKVSMEWIGEGWEGDYNPDDPEDQKLLRFDVYAHDSLENDHAEYSQLDDGFGYMSDSSYCTQIPLGTPDDVVMKALFAIMNEVKDTIINGGSVKKICEQLSWLSTSDFEN